MSTLADGAGPAGGVRPDTPALFQLRGVSRRRPDAAGRPVPILDHVDLDLVGGLITTLVGPSGAGKSSLLHLLNRLDEPDEGSIHYQGRDLRQWDVVELRRSVGLVLQAPVMLPGTVEQNVAAGPRLRGESLPRERAEELVRLVGLDPALLERRAADLSGGEQQRVSLARTLANQPRVLLLDEVTASLDPGSARDVEDLIVDLTGRLSLTAVWITHNLAQAERCGQRLVLLVRGRVAEEASARDFFSGPSTKEGRRFLESGKEVHP
ncbi:MAG: phosphate ABC transporter ATP-binding protein [Bacillota bacterium]